MSADQAQVLDTLFADAVADMAPVEGRELTGGLTAHRAISIFESQVLSRHIDFAARRLRADGIGYYTIRSAGHEGNAAVAAALRRSDPALLHYRSGAFFEHRARKSGGKQVDAARDVLLGMVASRDESIAGGRHKVFGSRALNIPPQTSTIASHLPKAVGMAFAFERKKRLGVPLGLPDDAIVVCSFGDASANHSTAVGAINTACRSAHQNLPTPVLFVCEDNGLGISVRTPPAWIESAYRDRAHLAYFRGDGCGVESAYEAAVAAVEHVRTTRSPAFLHLATVRFMGHAGSDVELAYRTPVEIRADHHRDPIIATARVLVESGTMTINDVRDEYAAARDLVAGLVDEVVGHPKLRDADDVMAPISPRDPEAVAEQVARPIEGARLWSDTLPEQEGPLPLVGHLNRALGDLLAKYPELLVFGEDVGRKGGVYGVTRNLAARAGAARVFDTVLDEQAILGVAIGAGQLGLLPIPEIQYLAYLHNAIDQLRGEAATLAFFSQGQFLNPMVVRIASYAYQKGFGGHFHNDNAIASLRDIPGLVIASPSRGDDAAAMLRTCVAAASEHGTVCAFLEPIALYSTRDLYEDGDGLYALPYDPAGEHVPIGAPRFYGEGSDLLIVTFGNGVRMSRRVARAIEQERGAGVSVMDLRWIAPLPVEQLVARAGAAKAVLVVDETRASGGVSEGVMAALIDGGYRGPLARVAALDSFIPLGDAANFVLIQEADIERAALELLPQ
jgi:2-oxoisovalerate dehydrogenase E1 component